MDFFRSGDGEIRVYSHMQEERISSITTMSEFIWIY